MFSSDDQLTIQSNNEMPAGPSNELNEQPNEKSIDEVDEIDEALNDDIDMALLEPSVQLVELTNESTKSASTESKKSRKKHAAFEHDGHTWHVNKMVKDGQTIYYVCAK